MVIDLKDVLTLLTGIAGSTVISKIIEARQAARKLQTLDTPIEKGKLELEREKLRLEAEKADRDADDKLIARYEAVMIRQDAQIEALEAQNKVLIIENARLQGRLERYTGQSDSSNGARS